MAKYSRVVKFGAVGAVNTLVDFLVFTLCSELGRLSPAQAQTAGYLSGIVCSFVLNRLVTFADAEKVAGAAAVGRVARFALVNLASWGASTAMIRALTGAGVWKYAAKVVVTGAAMVINYFGYKILVFHIRENGD